MTAKVLDGRAVARQIYDEIKTAGEERVARGGSRPRLATVLVGDDPASATYVDLKQRNAHNVGIDSEDHRLPSTTTTDELEDLHRLHQTFDWYGAQSLHLHQPLEQPERGGRQQNAARRVELFHKRH